MNTNYTGLFPTGSAAERLMQLRPEYGKFEVRSAITEAIAKHDLKDAIGWINYMVWYCPGEAEPLPWYTVHHLVGLWNDLGQPVRIEQAPIDFCRMVISYMMDGVDAALDVEDGRMIVDIAKLCSSLWKTYRNDGTGPTLAYMLEDITLLDPESVVKGYIAGLSKATDELEKEMSLIFNGMA
jgi:hypothetical protein